MTSSCKWDDPVADIFPLRIQPQGVCHFSGSSRTCQIRIGGHSDTTAVFNGYVDVTLSKLMLIIN